MASLVEELTLEEQAVVIQLLQVVIGNRSKKHSVMDIVEMEATGKELWRLGIDASGLCERVARKVTQFSFLRE